LVFSSFRDVLLVSVTVLGNLKHILDDITLNYM
jgi:hypothetical protein